jgi:hypothetical protein
MTPVAGSVGVVVATSIVDTGVTIRPAPGILVDSGTSVTKLSSGIAGTGCDGRHHQTREIPAQREVLYHDLLTWTTATVSSQRHARVGRESDGFVIAPAQHGTGLFENPWHNLTRFIQANQNARNAALQLTGVTCNFEWLSETRTACDIWEFKAMAAERFIPGSMMLGPYICAYYAMASELGGLSLARTALLSGEGPKNTLWVRTIDYYSPSKDYKVPPNLFDTRLASYIGVYSSSKFLRGRLIRYRIDDLSFETV